MTAVTYELALNQSIQERLINDIEEAEKSLGDAPITYDVLNKIKYLDMVVMEVLRLHSPAVLIDRLCSKRFHLTDGEKVNVHIEKGDHVWIPIYCFHHNEEYFPQPEVFDPDRFSDENRKNIEQGKFVPFGMGEKITFYRTFFNTNISHSGNS